MYTHIHTYIRESQWRKRQREGECSSEGSALCDMFFHQIHLGSGCLMV